jgi:opacity protein-like surface antigen
MKKIAMIALSLLLCMPLAVGARTAGTITLSGYGGVGLPLKPDFFKDYFKLGVGFGGEVRFNLAKMTSLSASFTHQLFRLNTDKFTDYVTETRLGDVKVSGGNIKCNIISVNLIEYLTPPEARSGFYLTLGGGYYMLPSGEVTVKVGLLSYTEKIDIDEKKFGLNGGLGLEASLNPYLNLFIEGKYHLVFTEETSNASMDEDANSDFSGKTSFITVMGGLRFQLQ